MDKENKDSVFEKKKENALHKSEIDFLKAKFQFEIKQQKINYNAKIDYDLKIKKAKLEEEYKQKLEEQKAIYENKIQELTNFYEQEILRRQGETAKWHEENTQKLLDEQKQEYEIKLSEKEQELQKALETKTILEAQQENKNNQECQEAPEAQNVQEAEESMQQEKEQPEDNGLPTIDDDNPIKVSAILPIYNVGKYLRQCLNSLINQSLYDIEIICVNDGSTDECYDILEDYKQKDGRIKVIHKENEGTGIARNTGLKVATGECIAFVDPDDWIKDNMFERLYELIKEKQLDIAMCMPDGFDEQNQKFAPFPYFVDDNFNNIPEDKIFNWQDLSPFSYPMCVWNKMYRRKLLTDNNIDFAERVDFEDHKVIFGTLFYAKRIFFIREKLYVYRYNREGSILSDNNKRLIDRMKMFDYVKQIMIDTNAYDSLKGSLLLYQVHDLIYYYSMIKPEFKEEYFNAMAENIKKMDLTEDEKNVLMEKEPDFKDILEKI